MTREEAIDRLKNMAWIYGSSEREQNIEAIDMAIEALSADAEWIESRYVCTCSHCGYLVELKTPFCPNCGVKMKGEYK